MRLARRLDSLDDERRARAVDLDHFEHARFEPVRLQIEQVPHQVVGRASRLIERGRDRAAHGGEDAGRVQRVQRLLVTEFLPQHGEGLVERVAALGGVHAHARFFERACAEPHLGLRAKRTGRLQLEQAGAAALRLVGGDRRQVGIRQRLEFWPICVQGLGEARLRPPRRRWLNAIPSSNGLGSSGASSSISATLSITSAALASSRSSVAWASCAAISAEARGTRWLNWASRGRNGSGAVGSGQRAASRPQTQRASKRMPAQVSGSITSSGARSSWGSNSTRPAISRSSPTASARVTRR